VRSSAPARRATAIATAYAVAVALIAGRPAAGAVAFGLAALLRRRAYCVVRRSLGARPATPFGALSKVVELGCYAALVAMWS